MYTHTYIHTYIHVVLHWEALIEAPCMYVSLYVCIHTYIHAVSHWMVLIEAPNHLTYIVHYYCLHIYFFHLVLTEFLYIHLTGYIQAVFLCVCIFLYVVLVGLLCMHIFVRCTSRLIMYAYFCTLY